MSSTDESSIVIVDQAKKKVISLIRMTPLAIVDTRILVDLIVINAFRAELLVGTNWLRRYSADLFFNKKRLVFKSKE